MMFAIGLLVGAILGFIAAGLCSIARQEYSLKTETRVAPNGLEEAA